MIYNARDRDVVEQRSAEQRRALEDVEERLRQLTFAEEDIQRATEGARARIVELGEEIAVYDRLQKGAVPNEIRLDQVGMALVAIRFRRGETQKDFARGLGTSQNQVSRYENGDYVNVSVLRVAQWLSGLGFEARLTLKDTTVPPPAEEETPIDA